MAGIAIGLAVVALLAVVIRAGIRSEEERRDGVVLSPEEIQASIRRRENQITEARRVELDGKRNPALVCPHCQERGKIRTKAVKKKAGISGGKATAAVLTGGVSVLATGLSRKEALTQAHCDNCSSTWVF